MQDPSRQNALAFGELRTSEISSSESPQDPARHVQPALAYPERRLMHPEITSPSLLASHSPRASKGSHGNGAGPRPLDAAPLHLRWRGSPDSKLAYRQRWPALRPHGLYVDPKELLSRASGRLQCQKLPGRVAREG